MPKRRAAKVSETFTRGLEWKQIAVQARRVQAPLRTANLVEPRALRRIGLLDAAERRRRPARPRTITFESLFREGINFDSIIPIECARMGDRQVLAARGPGHLDLPIIDLAVLRPIESVHSIAASTPIECTIPLPNADELFTHVIQGVAPDARTLANLPNLRRLSIGSALGRRALAIDQLPVALEALRLERHLLPEGLERPSNLHSLLRFTGLKQLSVNHCWRTDSVAPLAALTQLVRLRCNAPKGWSALKACHLLEEVFAITPQMPNLRCWRSWSRLRYLLLTGTGVRSLDGIDELCSLESLELVMMNVPSLDALGDHPVLAELCVRGLQNVTDLSPLGRLPSLRRLTFKWVSGGTRDILHVATIRPLAKATALEELSLAGTIIGDGNLSPLVDLPNLRRVEVFGDLGSAVQSLRRARPDLEVIWNQPRQTTGEMVGKIQIHAPVEGTEDWWLSEDLTTLLGAPTNHDAERKLKAKLKEFNPSLLERIHFDTEAGSVVVLARSRVDICAVAGLIES